MTGKRRWTEVDRQWVATRPEANDIVRMLSPAAGREGRRIGVTPDRDGFLVIVEKLEEDD